MATPCPFCGRSTRDLFALALHLDDDHPGREGELVIAVAPQPDIFPCVDIDAVHRLYPSRGVLFPAEMG
jgi:hypothetical protein